MSATPDQLPKLPLLDWAKLRYDPPPSIRTLRAWVRDGRIYPEPELVGRGYRVQPDAIYVPPCRKLRIESIPVIHSRDPVVHEIFTSGKTQKRRQA